MKPSDTLRDYVEEKVAKVTKLLDSEVESHVVLSVEKRFNVAHIDLLTDGAHRVRAEERGEEMYGVIDTAIDKLVRQIKRYREKTKAHHGPSPTRELSRRVFRADRDETTELLKGPQIVRQETLVARHLSVEDAMIQMDLLESDFLVFTDAMTNQLNVMYRLPEGHYGLIEARAS